MFLPVEFLVFRTAVRNKPAFTAFLRSSKSGTLAVEGYSVEGEDRFALYPVTHFHPPEWFAGRNNHS